MGDSEAEVTMTRCAIGVLAVALAGCGAAMMRRDAMHMASAEHRCPREYVHVTHDAAVGTRHAYWMHVCGRERLYRYTFETEYAGRFVDITDQTR
jgi:hypothetical protein